MNENVKLVTLLPTASAFSQEIEPANSAGSSSVHLPDSVQQAGKSPVNKLRGKPKSAGNAGFRKHNKMKFMKTEKLRKLNGK